MIFMWRLVASQNQNDVFTFLSSFVVVVSGIQKQHAVMLDCRHGDAEQISVQTDNKVLSYLKIE